MHQVVGNIKKLRKLRNFTQKHMADEMNMTQANYSKIEAGEVDIPYSRLEQIAKALKTNVEDLITYDERRVFNTYFDKVEAAQTTHTSDILGNKVFIEDVKNLYEARINDLKQENQRLHSLLEKSLTK